MRISLRSQVLLLASLMLFCAAMAIASQAQSFSTLLSFDFTDGYQPDASLVQGVDGNFYGTTVGGSGNFGTVFKITPAGSLTTLYAFAALTNGSGPEGALTQGSDGNFYGTTTAGGANGGGTIFKITPAGMLTTLYSFSGPDGFSPIGPLLQASDGNFYGIADGGGNSGCTDGCGTVFKITPGGMLTTLYLFCSQTHCTDGAIPNPGLVQGTDGNFYGTTQSGGSSTMSPCQQGQFAPGCGTVFKITPTGAFTTLYSFCTQTNCTDGQLPSAGLVQATDGNFYGTTYGGGPTGAGVVYRINPIGVRTTIYNFCSQSNCTDGFNPTAALVQGTDGNLYGTNLAGGESGGCNSGLGCGTIFKVAPSGTFATLHTFNGYDGFLPETALIQATDGNFYGTTEAGGSSGWEGYGTVYRISTNLTPFVEVQPTIGAVGTPVTILGTNLTGATTVTFNGTPATILTNTGSAITTTVPAGATTGTVQVTVGGNTLISNTDFQVTGPIQFVPVPPCRLIDTRQNGQHPIQGGTSENFIVPQLGSCGIPDNAAAYSLNLTVVPNGPLGYLTIWPEGEIQPFVSTMNSDGRTKANAAIVPSGNNAVSVYVTDTTNLILDIDGYFVPAGSQTYEFYPLTPCRVVDTRQTNFPQGLGAPRFGNMETRPLPVLSSPCLQGLPSQPQAYSFNVTVVPNPSGQPLNYLTIWPSNQTQPVVSTLNNPTATVVANAAIVPADPSTGDVSVFTYNSTDVIIDVNGYFATPGSNGYSLYPTVPCRAFDSRTNNGQPFTEEKTVNIVGSACAPPSNAAGYVFNATVVPSGSLGYLTLWPDGSQGGQPVVSTLNASDGSITSNMAIVPNIDGSTDAYAAYGYTQLILDLSGYFAP